MGTEADIRIMLVAADPLSTRMDLLEEEEETIKKALASNNQRGEITPIHAFSGEDLVEKARAHQPEVVHFTGHGSPTGRILLENKQGRMQRKTGKSIAQLLKRAELKPECIVLNNCSIDRQKDELLSACDNLITMAAPEGFDFALGFASGLYRGLKSDRDYERAYKHARSEMDQANILNLVRVEFQRPQTHREALKSGNSHGERLPKGFDLGHVVEFDSLPAPRTSSKISDDNAPRKYQVWFGTNRRPFDSVHPENGFGPERDNQIHYGRCEVAIPKFHRIGSVGSPWWRRWPVWQDDRLRLVSIIPWDASRFLLELQTALAPIATDERVILLFVHGYNVSFDEAAVRAAQLGADLSVPGVTAFYSWPSKGRVKDYAADVASVEASENYMREFLEMLASASGAERIHVVAHSMGNRGLIRAFNALFSKVSRDAKIRFNQIFLAAPDIDCALFKQLAGAYTQLSERTTLYISSKDKALWGSSYLHDYPRAGYKPPVTIVDGVDTVEVSSIDVSFLGHSYIAAARDVLHDMHALMLGNTPPDARMGLELLVDPATSLKYWRLRA